MLREWTERNPIVANLLNPAFCGEIIRRSAASYNANNGAKFPFAFSFLVLPILLHKDTRERMPRSTNSYLFVWVEENEDLFYNFSKRAKEMVPFAKESMMFLLQNKLIEINDKGQIEVPVKRMRKFQGEDLEECEMILRKSEMLGKWLSQSSNVNSVYSFFRIIP
ncbi:MAG: DUF6521 family protein [Bacteroidota bacterium]|nr:DUF6521 family protein [Bacteroidota bacterium]